MSFFDEGGEPTRRGTRPRQTAPGARGAGAMDPQTMMVRRGVAAGAALLVLILLVVGIRGCVNSSKERHLRDYNREVSSIAAQSNDESKQFFSQLNQGGGQAIDLQTQISQIRSNADALVKRARGLGVPDQMRSAQQSLTTVLELRRDALGAIAARIPTALGKDGADKAVAQIAGQMSALLASDVLYSQRVTPFIKGALDDNGVRGQATTASQFLPDVSYLDEAKVGSILGASVSASAGGTVAPGTHGHGLMSVAVGSTTLTPDGANRIPAGANVTFAVKFANQGENDESNVTVKITITGSGKDVTASTKVPLSKAGTETTTDVVLESAPPIGTPVTVTAEVMAVPGEKKTDNNSQKFPVLFQP